MSDNKEIKIEELMDKELGSVDISESSQESYDNSDLNQFVSGENDETHLDLDEESVEDAKQSDTSEKDHKPNKGLWALLILALVCLVIAISNTSNIPETVSDNRVKKEKRPYGPKKEQVDIYSPENTIEISQYLKKRAEFEPSEEIKNASFTDGKIQFRDAIFRTDGSMTYKEAMELVNENIDFSQDEKPEDCISRSAEDFWGTKDYFIYCIEFRTDRGGISLAFITKGKLPQSSEELVAFEVPDDSILVYAEPDDNYEAFWDETNSTEAVAQYEEMDKDCLSFYMPHGIGFYSIFTDEQIQRILDADNAEYAESFTYIEDGEECEQEVIYTPYGIIDINDFNFIYKKNSPEGKTDSPYIEAAYRKYFNYDGHKFGMDFGLQFIYTPFKGLYSLKIPFCYNFSSHVFDDNNDFYYVMTEEEIEEFNKQNEQEAQNEDYIPYVELDGVSDNSTE